MLVRSGKVVEIEGRRFKAFMDCTIEQINPEIIVSDYAPYRREPINQRKATVEVADVTSYLTTGGGSIVELEILSRFTYTHTCVGKTIIAKVIELYTPQCILVFSDNTYFTSTMDESYGEQYEVSRPLSIDDLSNMNLLTEDDITRIHESKLALKNIQERMNMVREIAAAKKLLAEHGEL